jgi:pyridoxamine 5'-phosphate oxidase
MSIDREDLDPDPVRQLELWLTDARDAGLVLPEAFALATADAGGEPSVRILLLRGLGPDGLRFYTHRRSRKARDVAANPRAAALFHWPALERQVRVSGRVDELDRAESAAYFATRPRGHQLAAWASQQGEPIGSREELEQQARDAAKRFAGVEAVPLPDFWGGYRLVPERYEFWLSGPDRLHDRIEYARDATGSWIRRRLQP